jgi:acetylornithine deacetylase/succinyl-diaminopimelate desuccinylase-like protein
MPNWDQVEAQASDLLAAYLRINTTNPPGQEAAAAAFLAGVFAQHGILAQVAEAAPGRANLLAVLPAADVRQPPLLLTHHMDVVTADAAEWSLDPFGGLERDGYLYGRGALDTKGLGIMHLLGMLLLQASGGPRHRHVLYLAVADEEVNSAHGMVWALDHWRDELAGATAWGEGGMGLRGVLGPAPFFGIATAEKLSLTLRLTAHGQSGHGSSPHRQNANEILAQAIVRVAAWEQPLEITPVAAEMMQQAGTTLGGCRGWLLRRPQQSLTAPLYRSLLAAQPLFAAMLHDTVSVTIVRGGDKDNVIPGVAEATLDVRLLPGREPDSFIARLKQVVQDPRIEVTVLDTPTAAPVSPTTNPLYTTLSRVIQRQASGALVSPMQLTGCTDGRWLRRRGLPTYGLAPIIVDEQELAGIHGPDERLSRANLRLGTRIVFETLLALCGDDGLGS